jgi:hypothetical protein
MHVLRPPLEGPGVMKVFFAADDPFAGARPLTYARSLARPDAWRVLLVVGAFGLYWLSAVVLQSRGGTTHFGADAHLYSLLADGIAHDRVARFHPITTTLAAVWLKLLSPLTAWMAPLTLLKGLFALVGAVGVWAATAAAAEVVPRRQATLLGAIYATSLGVWYFSSIEESKIVSATLVALYIAAYLRLRQSWSLRGAVLLSAILLVACLNEIVAGFLVLIPAVDALVQRGWRLEGNWWIGWHALAAPLALVFLEAVVNGRLVGAGTDLEGASHVSMLLFYVTQNQYSIENFVEFAARWLLYSVAAPSIDASFAAGTSYSGDYGPDVTPLSYFASPVTTALVLVLGLILAASFMPRYRQEGLGDLAGIPQALLAYCGLRAAFFFVVYPGECLLFSSSTTLAHILLVAIPFSVSHYPWKKSLLGALAALLFITNGSFIVGE